MMSIRGTRRPGGTTTISVSDPAGAAQPASGQVISPGVTIHLFPQATMIEQQRDAVVHAGEDQGEALGRQAADTGAAAAQRG